MSNLKYWLWLTSLREPRNTEKRELLQRLGGPERLYYAEEEELALTGLSRRGVEALADKSMDAAERILERCDSLGLRILTMEDTEYPQRLKSVYDPPLLLYVRGRLPRFDDECAVAVVGTRTCTPYGELSAEKLSFAMAKQGALILSGLAKGIDAAAHRGALRAGGCTVGVIAGGHDIVYPPSSRYLYEDVAAAGAILSEYPPGTEHRGSHFPVRNRIISGLSVAALVVEAPVRSGALITAHTALEQGRDVFAVPGPIDAPMSAGCIQLLREGAGIAAESGDILLHFESQFPGKLRLRPVEPPEHTGYQARAEEAQNREEARIEAAAEPERTLRLSEESGLTDDQIHILQALQGRTMQADELIEMTQIPARRVLSALTLLQLEGHVQEESGKRFTLAVRIIP